MYFLANPYGNPNLLLCSKIPPFFFKKSEMKYSIEPCFRETILIGNSKPCSTVSNFLPIDCPIQSVECPIYPSGTSATITSFSGILGKVITDYLTSIDKTADNCNLNALQTEWFVDLRLNDSIIVQNKFFNGSGYNVSAFSSPTNTQWYNALVIALDDLGTKGYDYTLTNDGKVVIYNSICSEDGQGLRFRINVGINLNLCCN